MKESILSLDSVKAAMNKPHPAAVWAETAQLDPVQVDCITTEVLKVLDNKCKMGVEEQSALMTVYAVVKDRQGLAFDDSVHEVIARAQRHDGGDTAERIHELRLQAERVIPKPVMKYFKQFLRESLFGTGWSG